MGDNRRKVAVVTGGNRGIGLETVKILCQKFDGDVILCARSKSRSSDALRYLRACGYSPAYHQLDLESTASVAALRDDILRGYGGLDVLVNNAATSVGSDSEDGLTTVINTNWYGTLRVCDALLPLLNNGARVVNVSSRGARRYLQDLPDNLSQRLMAPGISMATLKAAIEENISYLKAMYQTSDTTQRTHKDYSLSKLALIQASSIQQRALDPHNSRDIVVNACCPGFVQTDLLSHITPPKAKVKTVAEGADVIAYLALLPPGTCAPKGQFVGERRIIPMYV